MRRPAPRVESARAAGVITFPRWRRPAPVSRATALGWPPDPERKNKRAPRRRFNFPARAPVHDGIARDGVTPALFPPARVSKRHQTIGVLAFPRGAPRPAPAPRPTSRSRTPPSNRSSHFPARRPRPATAPRTTSRSRTPPDDRSSIYFPRAARPGPRLRRGSRRETGCWQATGVLTSPRGGRAPARAGAAADVAEPSATEQPGFSLLRAAPPGPRRRRGRRRGAGRQKLRV